MPHILLFSIVAYVGKTLTTIETIELYGKHWSSLLSDVLLVSKYKEVC